MAGRKSKLTPALIKEAVDLIKIGNYNETVCQYLGIHKSTWYKWMAEGEKAKIGLKKEFFDSIKRAEAHAEIRNVQIIQRAAEESKNDPKLWTAAMTFLERKHPERWGKKDKVSADVEHSGQVKEQHEYNINIQEKIKQTEDKYGNAIERIVRDRLRNRVQEDVSASSELDS